jgi:hypothetical protein
MRDAAHFFFPFETKKKEEEEERVDDNYDAKSCHVIT